MEGQYSDNGLKNGPFKFYYPNGKLQASGNYENGKMFGKWLWYYEQGIEKATIYFTGNEQDFKFISFHDEKGNTLMDNGIGKFTWTPNIFEVMPGYIVNGSFNSGKRSGKWEFVAPGDNDKFDFKEVYDDNGKFKRARYNTIKQLNPSAPYPFHFTPFRLEMMESMSYDNYFRKNGDSVAVLALLNYLVEHKPTEIKLKYTNFDSVFAYIIRALNNYRYKFDYKNKDVDVDIEFKLGGNRLPEDVTVTGQGIDTLEKKFIIFFISKFRDIEMPGTRSIAIEGYHDIYMYNIDMSVFYPAGMRQYYNQELFFSIIPKQKMLTMLNADKKNIKKIIAKSLGY